MAVVYLARDLRHVRDVAVKIFRVAAGDEEGADRFLQEIQIAARLSHPNILPLHDSGEADGLLYYVMPYVPGESLRQRMEREGALPLADALAVATEVAGALAFAHSHGVIHRDIKPENILFISGHAVVADFGIARAISAGGWEEWKLIGPAGTPTYMSPEQARGGSRVDGRSDVYSLGCVLYEMLTGEPPFRGSTPEEVVVQHLEAEPLPVQTRRPALGPELQQAVGKALAKHPADRYQTAQQMADALGRFRTALASPSGEAGVDRGASLRQGAPGVAPRSRPPESRSWVRRWAAPVFAAVGIAFAFFWSSGLWPSARLDRGLYVIGPFQHRPGVTARLDGAQCARLVYQALTRWEDFRPADARWTADQLARLQGDTTLGDLLAIARRGRAGRLVSGEVWPWGDSLRVRGVLYDVREGSRPVRERTITIATDLSDAERKFAELADSLLLPRAQEPAAASGVLGTHVIAAWATYDSGHAALARWDLTEAERHFRAALVLDPSYGLAHLWLAQTLDWRGEDPASWRDDAQAGLEAGSALAPAGRAWGRALLALAEGRYQDACTQYEAMLRRDSLDFQAWFGRAECRAGDPVVIPDPASPSGWRFRSSYEAALRDYQRALTLVPAVHRAFKGAAFERLAGRLFAEPNILRMGHSEPAPGETFGGVQRLAGDTLVLVPFRLAQLQDSTFSLSAEPTLAAVARNRNRLRTVAAAWVQAYPESPGAHEALARALELQGELSSDPTTSDSALSEFRTARKLTRDSVAALGLASDEVRILLKLERFADAKRTTDSLLAGASGAGGEMARRLAGLAALTGRVDLAARLLQRAAPGMEVWGPDGPVTVPLPLRETAAAFEAYAALGGPSDSLQAVIRRTYRQLGSMVQGPERFAAERALLPQNLALAGGGPAGSGRALAGTNYLLDLQLAWQSGDSAAVRRGLMRLVSQRAGARPGDIAVEMTLQESFLQLQLGDTAAVVRRLDGVLQALPSLGTDVVDRVPQAGALVRLMKLRAELAVRSGERDVARRWAAPVVTLWSSAEPTLRRQAQELERLTAGI